MQQLTEPLLSNPAGQELRSTDRPMYGMAGVNVNGTLFLYGGFYGVPPWNMEALWTLPSTIEPKQLAQIKTDPTASPVLIYSQLLHPPGPFLYAFGGHYPTVSTTGSSNNHTMSITVPSSTGTSTVATTTQHEQENTISSSSSSSSLLTNATVPENLRYYRYDMLNHTWTPLKTTPSNITVSPLERYWHTATLSVNGSSAYLFGGMNITGPVNDFWSYEFDTNSWTPLPLPSLSWQARCGHTANMLSHGDLVILGGYHCLGNHTTNPVLPKTLIPLNQALIYNTITQRWSNQSLGGNVIPEARTYHSAVSTTNDMIMICGGQDGAAQPFQTYISAGGDPSAMTAVLDTHTWEWLIPTPSPYQPFPRSFASAVLVNDTKVMIGFGINYHTIYDGMYIFDVPQGSWIPASEPDARPIGDKIELIASLAVLGSFFGAIVLVALCIMINKLKHRLCEFMNKVKSDIWNPRAGEPMWAEMTRLFFRTTFLAIFSTVVVVLVLQVRNSPIIDQKYYVHNEQYTVDVPDIRFCFDGWTKDNSVTWPYIQCATDFGDSCSQYLIDISKNVETGLNYYGTTLRCYLFRTPPSFKLGRTNDRIISNGSYLKFYYYGDRLSSNASHLHLVFYNKYHNPNLPVYHIDDPYGLPFSWYSDSEDAQFQSAEEENLRTENAFDLNPNVGSTSSFATIEREEMQPSNFWNYVGIAALHKRAYEIESKAVSETVTTVYATEPQPLGSLHVFPASYEVTVLREQRAFTLVNAMGIIGGIFGLIVGLQACLFGKRPSSPVGLIHRWGMGHMRWSITQALLASRQASFIGGTLTHSSKHNVKHHTQNQSQQDYHEHRRGDIYEKSDYYRLEHPMDEGEEVQQEQQGGTMLSKDKTWAASLPTVTEVAATRAQQRNLPDDTRLTRMEERLYLMELLFKSYYINDEVFQSLDKAIKKDIDNTDVLLDPPVTSFSTIFSRNSKRSNASSDTSTSTSNRQQQRHKRRRWFHAFKHHEPQSSSSPLTTSSSSSPPTATSAWNYNIQSSLSSSTTRPFSSLAHLTRDFIPSSSPQRTTPLSPSSSTSSSSTSAL